MRAEAGEMGRGLKGFVPPATHPLISLPLTSGLPVSRDTTVLKSGQLITLQWLLRVQQKERLHMRHTSNQILEMIKLGEKACQKPREAEAGHLAPVKAVNATEKFLKEI